MPDQSPQLMQCMEVWGGNALVDSGVSMAGLDAWVYSKPYQSADAGGDVYYVSSCATGRITRLLLADVAGHGAAVCDTAGVLRELMRRYVNHLDQGQFVKSMNQRFVEFSAADCFATAVVMTFFAPTNTLTLSNAGHPAPLVYRMRQKQWNLLDSRAAVARPGIANIPLGIENLTRYDELAIDLEVGDLVLCYSDSLIESLGASGQMLGESGLLEVARGLVVDDPAKVSPDLLQRILDLSPMNLSNDDVTILLFRPNGLAPRVPIRNRLLAPLRVAAGVVKALRPHGGPMPLPDISLANIGGAMFDRFNRRWNGRRDA